MEKYDIKSDKAKNRLYLRLEGFLDDDSAKNADDQVVIETDKLTKGFDVINDISKFKPGTQNVANEIKRAQQYIASKGAARVVRIVKSKDDLDIGSMQFKRQSKAVGYEAMIAESIDEAEKMLDK